MQDGRFGQAGAATDGLPPGLWRAALAEAATRDMVTARRLVLLALLWQEGYQTQASLLARAERRLGRECFGRSRALTFRRDMQAVKAILAAQGHTLRYSRQSARPGYLIAGRPDLTAEVRRAIRGAVEDVDPRQIEAFDRMTPGRRVQVAVRLSDDLLRTAAGQLMREQPGLGRPAARREVLHRYYQAGG